MSGTISETYTFKAGSLKIVGADSTRCIIADGLTDGAGKPRPSLPLKSPARLASLKAMGRTGWDAANKAGSITLEKGMQGRGKADRPDQADDFFGAAAPKKGRTRKTV